MRLFLDANGRLLRRCNAGVVLALITMMGSVHAGVIDVRIDHSHNDAEELADGRVSRGSADLDLVEEGGSQRLVGLRFHSLAIPQGATISAAWVQFATDETSSGAASFVIDAAAADTTKSFKTTRYSISSLPRTSAKASWSPPSWDVVGEAGAAQRTDDLSAVIEEVISRSGWVSGNAITLVIDGSGRRVAEAWNGDAAAAPLLHVEFSGGDNAAPVVDAGQDVAITLPTSAVALDGTVSDDGLPETGQLSVTWSHVGGTGTGTVTFDDANAVDTTATFSADAGSYILRLTATDGDLTTSDEMTVQVYAEGTASAVLSITQVNYFDTGYDAAGNPLTIASTDPAGVLYDASTGNLLIADSEITEIPEVWDNEPYNVFETDRAGNLLVGKYDITPTPSGIPNNKEATGIAYCGNDGSYYVSNDDSNMVYRYSFVSGSGFTLTDTVSTDPETGDPEGITCDSQTGRIFVIGGNAINIVVYRYGSNGFELDNVIDLSVTAGTPDGIPNDPEGIAFDAVSGHLFVMSNNDDAIFEFTDAGVFLNKFDISAFSPMPKQPQGLSIGPSSVTPGQDSFYISDAMNDNDYDPDERDGRIFEAEIQRN